MPSRRSFAADLLEGKEAFRRADYPTALRLWSPWAEGGEASAQYNLGLLFAGGLGVERDDERAADWYRRAADNGDADAQHNLSLMYATGLGVPQDDDLAVEWERKSAAHGYAPALNGLGYMYFLGRGVTQDYAEAARWYRSGAEKGDADAQYSLGLMYAQGLGVAVDFVEAHRLFSNALEGWPLEDAGGRARLISNIERATARLAPRQSLLGRLVAAVQYLKHVPAAVRMMSELVDAQRDAAQHDYLGAQTRLARVYDLAPPGAVGRSTTNLLMALVSLRLGNPQVAADLAPTAVQNVCSLRSYANKAERRYLSFVGKLIYEEATTQLGMPTTLNVGVEYDEVDAQRVRKELRNAYPINQSLDEASVQAH